MWQLCYLYPIVASTKERVHTTSPHPIYVLVSVHCAMCDVRHLESRDPVPGRRVEGSKGKRGPGQGPWCAVCGEVSSGRGPWRVASGLRSWKSRNMFCVLGFVSLDWFLLFDCYWYRDRCWRRPNLSSY